MKSKMGMGSTQVVTLGESVLEDLAFENVKECPELADELQFLNGRKFVDDGRLYEIYQLRYDEGSGHIIGWRRPLSKTFHRDDGIPYTIYGREGLYELSEIYLLNNPEEQNPPTWPRGIGGWAAVQEEDEESRELKYEIGREGGTTRIIGRSKYTLKLLKMAFHL